MKKIYLLGILFALLNFSCDDKRSKAEKAVLEYAKTLTNKYEPISFGEFFEQLQPELIEQKLKTDKKIKYSLVHSFESDKGTISNMYFHLTKNLEVVGELTDFEMDEIAMVEIGDKLDSIKKFLEDSMLKAMENPEK